MSVGSLGSEQTQSILKSSRNQ